MSDGDWVYRNNVWVVRASSVDVMSGNPLSRETSRTGACWWRYEQKSEDGLWRKYIEWKGAASFFPCRLGEKIGAHLVFAGRRTKPVFPDVFWEDSRAP